MYVTTWSWDFEGTPRDFEDHVSGFHRSSLVNRASGALHTEVGLCRLEGSGSIDPHVHSFERCAYILGGEPVVEVDGRAYELTVGDYVLFNVGMAHAWRNPDGAEARWFEVSTPQPLPTEGARPDTLFIGRDRDTVSPTRPRFGDPRTRFVGHYPGTPPQREALGLDGAPRERAPAGMDTALLAYSGISVKMMVDSGAGADLLTMFMVDYEPNGAAQLHDHPFEEVYFFLDGEIEGEVGGRTRTFHAGEVLFCGVGDEHGFFNTSGGRVRWIETQAPQPPRRHSYRFPAHWDRVAHGLGAEGA